MAAHLLKCFASLLLLVLLLPTDRPVCAQDATIVRDDAPLPPPLKFYKGRQIATTMSYIIPK